MGTGWFHQVLHRMNVCYCTFVNCRIKEHRFSAVSKGFLGNPFHVIESHFRRKQLDRASPLIFEVADPDLSGAAGQAMGIGPKNVVDTFSTTSVRMLPAVFGPRFSWRVSDMVLLTAFLSKALDLRIMPPSLFFFGMVSCYGSSQWST